MMSDAEREGGGLDQAKLCLWKQTILTIFQNLKIVFPPISQGRF